MDRLIVTCYLPRKRFCTTYIVCHIDADQRHRGGVTRPAASAPSSNAQNIVRDRLRPHCQAWCLEGVRPQRRSADRAPPTRLVSAPSTQLACAEPAPRYHPPARRPQRLERIHKLTRIGKGLPTSNPATITKSPPDPEREAPADRVLCRPHQLRKTERMTPI